MIPYQRPELGPRFGADPQRASFVRQWVADAGLTAADVRRLFAGTAEAFYRI
jgi:hypothetical protein